MGRASAANWVATFKRLNRTRAEHRACLHVFPKTRLRFSTSVNRDLRKSDSATGEISWCGCILYSKMTIRTIQSIYTLMAVRLSEAGRYTNGKQEGCLGSQSQCIS